MLRSPAYNKRTSPRTVCSTRSDPIHRSAHHRRRGEVANAATAEAAPAQEPARAVEEHAGHRSSPLRSEAEKVARVTSPPSAVPTAVQARVDEIARDLPPMPGREYLLSGEKRDDVAEPIPYRTPLRKPLSCRAPAQPSWFECAIIEDCNLITSHYDDLSPAANVTDAALLRVPPFGANI